MVIIFLLMIIFAYNLTQHSQIGRAFKTIKCDIEVSSIIGVPVLRYKVFAFALSAFYAAVGGGMLTIAIKFISPESYGLEDSIQYKIAMILGGAGSILGSVFGGLYLAFEPNVGSWMATVIPRGEKLTLGLSGALLVLVVYQFPRGIAGELVLFLKSRFLTRPRRGQYYINPPADYDYLGSMRKSFDPSEVNSNNK
jgi:branched-chain amino acid transport system permease protein